MQKQPDQKLSRSSESMAPHRFVARGGPSHRLQMVPTFPIYIHRTWPSQSHHTKFIQTGGQIHETYRAWQAINFQTWPLSKKLHHQHTAPGRPHTSSPQDTTNAFGVQMSVGPRQTSWTSNFHILIPENNFTQQMRILDWQFASSAKAKAKQKYKLR